MQDYVPTSKEQEVLRTLRNFYHLCIPISGLFKGWIQTRTLRSSFKGLSALRLKLVLPLVFLSRRILCTLPVLCTPATH